MGKCDEYYDFWDEQERLDDEYETQQRILDFTRINSYCSGIDDMVAALNNIFSWRHDMKEVQEIAEKLKKETIETDM